jgi:hypothetical protein
MASPYSPVIKLDNASTRDMDVGYSYFYKIEIRGGYFGTGTNATVYTDELSSAVSPGNAGGLSYSTSSVSGGTATIYFNQSSGTKITVQYKRNNVLTWTDPSVSTVEREIGGNREINISGLTNGTYDIRYKYRNDSSTSYSTQTSVFVIN